ncbi:unnamed protein product [Cuscuta epithymum]|uniref:Protein kinase domain-containing protein n=1 Tax=Cuscuta epithymum TaxID=186058 RepID=A0AAV0EYY8_9ASTE|nr:unnamed protein product [Cuscuta epithymum]
MTMFQSLLAAGEGNSGCRTVVVGIKLDARSRELLTWALVKVAQSGDRVIALHVLNNNEAVDPEGKSSLLSLVKGFDDSILAVYEGFCNLKQVDLKLKICRGSSVREVLVREAKSYLATDLIVGTSRSHHRLRSSTHVAKYCAEKLPSDCSVSAVNNGKVVFRREASRPSQVTSREVEHLHRNVLLSAIRRTSYKNSKVLNDNNSGRVTLREALSKHGDIHDENAPKEDCSICLPDHLQNNSSFTTQSTDEPLKDKDDESSMAMVPVEKQEDPSRSSITLLINELQTEVTRPGWPLLRHAVNANRPPTDRSTLPQISVVQWALRLPSRQPLHFDELNGVSGAIVPYTNEAVSHTSGTLPEELLCLHEKYAATCRLFKYQELLSATLDFSPDNVIGKGGSSKVYRGCLPDGKELAVKILKPSENALREFILEIEIITALHHKNIITLFGFCFENNHLFLVYDFLSRGSLEDNLHGTKKDPKVFSWNERYKVAVGVAEALEYLHNRDDQPVIHRDVKSSNILLSDDFEPKLSDFGLAKWAPTISSHITCTDVAGTFGYLAPEYFMYGKVNHKIDVYAFGVVLLELLSGRKPISSNYPKGQESLVMWAKPILDSGNYAQLLDPGLGSNYDCEQVERLVVAASLCVRRDPRVRPQMRHVLKLLRGDAEITEWTMLQQVMKGSEHAGSNAKQLPVGAEMAGDALDDDDDDGTTSLHDSTNIRSHLNLAMLGVGEEEDSLSVSSIDHQHISLEDYLRGRWSCSSGLLE